MNDEGRSESITVEARTPHRPSELKALEHATSLHGRKGFGLNVRHRRMLPAEHDRCAMGEVASKDERVGSDPRVRVDTAQVLDSDLRA
jgi:hypothetical protein